MQISHDPGSHDPDPGPQEKSMKKSCVSFETECSQLVVINFSFNSDYIGTVSIDLSMLYHKT